VTTSSRSARRRKLLGAAAASALVLIVLRSVLAPTPPSVAALGATAKSTGCAGEPAVSTATGDAWLAIDDDYVIWRDDLHGARTVVAALDLTGFVVDDLRPTSSFRIDDALWVLLNSPGRARVFQIDLATGAVVATDVVDADGRSQFVRRWDAAATGAALALNDGSVVLVGVDGSRRVVDGDTNAKVYRDVRRAADATWVAGYSQDQSVLERFGDDGQTRRWTFDHEVTLGDLVVDGPCLWASVNTSGCRAGVAAFRGDVPTKAVIGRTFGACITSIAVGSGTVAVTGNASHGSVTLLSAETGEKIHTAKVSDCGDGLSALVRAGRIFVADDCSGVLVELDRRGQILQTRHLIVRIPDSLVEATGFQWPSVITNVISNDHVRQEIRDLTDIDRPATPYPADELLLEPL
jgi:hypothetical protein